MKFENATTTVHFGFGFKDNLVREITIIAISSFSKSSFIEILSVHTIMQSQRFQIPSASKSVYKKLRFWDGLVWTVGLAVEVKLRFQISLTYCRVA